MSLDSLLSLNIDSTRRMETTEIVRWLGEIEPTNPQNGNGGFCPSQEGLHTPYSFSVSADPEAITDGLNPLTISHTAKTISCRPIGTAKMI